MLDMRYRVTYMTSDQSRHICEYLATKFLKIGVKSPKIFLISEKTRVSTASFRLSMLWCSGLSVFRKFLKPLSTSALPCVKPAVPSAVNSRLVEMVYLNYSFCLKDALKQLQKQRSFLSTPCLFLGHEAAKKRGKINMIDWKRRQTTCGQ